MVRARLGGGTATGLVLDAYVAAARADVLREDAALAAELEAQLARSGLPLAGVCVPDPWPPARSRSLRSLAALAASAGYAA